MIFINEYSWTIIFILNLTQIKHVIYSRFQAWSSGPYLYFSPFMSNPFKPKQTHFPSVLSFGPSRLQKLCTYVSMQTYSILNMFCAAVSHRWSCPHRGPICFHFISWFISDWDACQQSRFVKETWFLFWFCFQIIFSL